MSRVYQIRNKVLLKYIMIIYTRHKRMLLYTSLFHQSMVAIHLKKEKKKKITHTDTFIDL